MGTFLLIAFVFVAVAYGTYHITRSKEASSGGGTRALEDFRGDAPRQLGTEMGPRSLMNLRLNDIVIYLDDQYIVEGRIHYSQGAWEWYSFHLECDGVHRWLGVEDDDGLTVKLWQVQESFEVPNPPPNTIDFHGETFRRVEKGTAQAQSIGRTGKPVNTTVEYHDYTGMSDRELAIENWSGDVEVSIGHEVNPDAITVLPGDDVAI
jgi:hypothetical protein